MGRNEYACVSYQQEAAALYRAARISLLKGKIDQAAKYQRLAAWQHMQAAWRLQRLLRERQL